MRRGEEDDDKKAITITLPFVSDTVTKNIKEKARELLLPINVVFTTEKFTTVVKKSQITWGKSSFLEDKLNHSEALSTN